jgi:hypothetical protein
MSSVWEKLNRLNKLSPAALVNRLFVSLISITVFAVVLRYCFIGNRAFCSSALRLGP